MPRIEGSTRRTLVRCLAAALLFLGTFGTFIPSDVHISTSDSQLRFSSDGKTIATATLCPGYQFDQFGVTGPTFSPDLHWVLVDVLGPFEPGNVARNHALVEVATGAIVPAAAFPEYLGVRSTPDALAWASGERQTLHYASGADATVHEPPLRPIPGPICRP
jgi:hypothetical protein